MKNINENNSQSVIVIKEKEMARRKFVTYSQFLSQFSGLDLKRIQELDLDSRVNYAIKNINYQEFDLTLSELYYILDFENGLMRSFAIQLKENNEPYWVFRQPEKVVIR